MDVGRLIMWLLVGVGALWVVGGAFLVSQDPSAWPPILIGVAIAGLGVGIRALVRKLDAGLDLRRVAPWMFVGFGCLMIAVGVWVFFTAGADGLWAMAFGVVFVGAGLLVRKLMAVPAGKREIAVEERGAAIATAGGSGTRVQRTLIQVDANASEADVARAREAWIRAHLARRPDWTSGRVVEDDARNRGTGRGMAIAWTGLALILAIVAAVTGEGFFWVAAVVIGAAAAVMIFRVVRAAKRQRKFGTSQLVLARTPVALGARLSGTVLTGVSTQTPARFRLVLECAHRWEESVGSGDDRRTRYHRDVLWRAEAQTFGQARDDAPGTAVPVEFELPSDRPGTTLGGGSEGISWALGVSAPLPGLDFGATFTLPVLPADEIPADPPAVATS